MGAMGKLRKQIREHGQRLDGICGRLNRHSDAMGALRASVEQVRGQQRADAGSMGTTVGGLVKRTSETASQAEALVSQVSRLTRRVDRHVSESDADRIAIGKLVRRVESLEAAARPSGNQTADATEPLEARILNVLRRAGGLWLSTLAIGANLAGGPKSLGGTLDDLVQRGLVERASSTPTGVLYRIRGGGL